MLSGGEAHFSIGLGNTELQTTAVSRPKDGSNYKLPCSLFPTVCVCVCVPLVLSIMLSFFLFFSVFPSLFLSS